MLALPPQRRRDDGRKTAAAEEEEEEEGGEFPVGSDEYHQFVDFGEGNLLDCIDFDDLFVEVEGEGELLPGLEMVDCDIAAEFSATSGRKGLEMNVSESEVAERAGNGASANGQDEDKDKSVSRRNESGPVDVVGTKGADRGGGGGKKSSSVQSKISPPQGKRKAKVDWTPDLHRRFVQAVEQLGLHKAVPSKILEIMGIECLTRHNIASHLQKYRSHRKHLLAREAEAASWNHQRRQVYNGGKAELSPWLSSGPAMGFPPPAAACPLQLPLRHLHVWGHPSADRSAWPKRAIHQLPPALHPRPPWQAVPLPYPLPPLLAPPVDPSSYWNPHHQQVPNAVTPGTPCFPQPRAFTGLMPGPPVPGIPPSAMYKVETSNGVLTDRSGSQPPPDFHPSKETIDAAIGDALAKPWQPLPLGLKPPSLDGVLTELHRQGIPNIPPSSPS